MMGCPPNEYVAPESSSTTRPALSGGYDGGGKIGGDGGEGGETGGANGSGGASGDGGKRGGRYGGIGGDGGVCGGGFGVARLLAAICDLTGLKSPPLCATAGMMSITIIIMCI